MVLQRELHRGFRQVTDCQRHFLQVGKAVQIACDDAHHDALAQLAQSPLEAVLVAYSLHLQPVAHLLLGNRLPHVLKNLRKQRTIRHQEPFEERAALHGKVQPCFCVAVIFRGFQYLVQGSHVEFTY